MNNYSLVLYGNPTPSDWHFLVNESLSSSSSSSSTRSDAQSAPPCFVASPLTVRVGVAGTKDLSLKD